MSSLTLCTVLALSQLLVIYSRDISAECMSKYLATTFSSGPACIKAAEEVMNCIKSTGKISEADRARFCALFSARQCTPHACGYEAFHHIMLSSVDPKRIKKNSEVLSSRPHLAGTIQDKRTAEEAEKRFKGAGMETLLDEFPVLLSYPVSRKVEITEPSSEKEVFTIAEDEQPATGQQFWEEAAPPFNGFSASGNVEGPVVFANYGTYEDYEAIKDVDLTGAVVVCKYGKVFRGTKAYLAEKRKAAAILIYLDPHDYGYERGVQYSKGPWATNTSVQRGTIYMGDGDPLTPGWPSMKGGPTKDMKDLFSDTPAPGAPLPTIPSQPIGSNIAAKLLKDLEGTAMPSSFHNAWKTTGMGPGPRKVRVNVQMKTNQTNIWNVFGRIQGAEEPDRTVYIGAHRDAWTYGTVDPVSGQSILWEIAEVLGGMVKQGWRPRRTIQFCSWDAEEYGLIGSMEYIEKKISQIMTHGVAYLNMDTAVQGADKIDSRGVPSLESVIRSVLSQIEYNSTHKAIDVYIGKIAAPGGGSDHGGFIRHATIPITELKFRADVYQYGAVYHSNYDSMYWVENFADPGWRAHGILSQCMGLLLLQLSDNRVLPFNLVDYGSFLKDSIQNLEKASKDIVVAPLWKAFTPLQKAILEVSSQQELMRAGMVDGVVWAKIRAMNDKLMYFERVFRGDVTLTGDDFKKHVLFAPAKYNTYASVAFPAITDALFETDVPKANFLIRRTALHLQAASDWLLDEPFPL